MGANEPPLRWSDVYSRMVAAFPGQSEDFYGMFMDFMLGMVRSGVYVWDWIIVFDELRAITDTDESGVRCEG